MEVEDWKAETEDRKVEVEGWKAEMEQEHTVGWGSKRRIQGLRGGKWNLRKEKGWKMGTQE